MRNEFLRFFFFFAIVLFQFSVRAGDVTQTFRGQVIDAYTELPLPGATVVIPGTDPLKGTSTDINGEFRFEQMPLGRLDVRVSMVGYQTEFQRNLLISSGRELVVRIRLEEQVYQLSDVEVRPEVRKDQAINEMAMVSARSFTIDETERYAGSLGDPARMAANFAGVVSASDQRNDIIIRGNSPLGLLWRLEGVEIPNPSHFGSIGSTGGPISMLNNNQLDNSDFYTGAFPAEYGNALAGAFDLRMRPGNNEKHEFMGQLGFNGFEFGAEGPVSGRNRSSYMVNVRYSTLEVLHSLGMSFGTGAAIPKYKDLSLKLNFPLNNGRLSVFGLGGNNQISMLDSEEDDAQFGFAGTDLYYSNGMGVMGVSHIHYFNENSRISNTLAVSGITGSVEMYDLEFDPDIRQVEEDLRETKRTFTSKLSHRFSARNYLNAGVIVDHFGILYEGRQYDKNENEYFNYLNSQGNTLMTRAFAEWKHRFSDELSVTSGLHSSRLFLNDTWSLEPRMGVKWEVVPGQSISLGAGMHSQSQMKALYFTQRLTDTLNLVYERTNEHLEFSRSLHFVAGYDRLLGEGHRLKAEVYYQYLYNIPVAWRRPEFSLLSQGGGFSFMAFDNMENSGTGENKGVELTLEKFLHEGFYYLVTASLFDSGYRGFDGVWRNSVFNNQYVVNALSGYEWSVGDRSLLSADVKVVYAGGAPYLEIDAAHAAEAGSAKFKWDEAYENRYPDYFRLNARITYRLNGRQVNQEWALDLQNLTNRENIFERTWDNNRKEINTSYQMGFMPMMTYRVYF